MLKVKYGGNIDTISDDVSIYAKSLPFFGTTDKLFEKYFELFDKEDREKGVPYLQPCRFVEESVPGYSELSKFSPELVGDEEVLTGDEDISFLWGETSDNTEEVVTDLDDLEPYQEVEWEDNEEDDEDVYVEEIEPYQTDEISIDELEVPLIENETAQKAGGTIQESWSVVERSIGVTPSEIPSQRDVPQSIREFLKLYPNSDISFVEQYFSKREIQKQVKLGRVYKRNGKLFI